MLDKLCFNKIKDYMSKIEGIDFSKNSLYLALILYLYLSMFQISPVFRILISACTLVQRLGLQFTLTCITSAVCVVYYTLFPFFDSVAAYIFILIIIVMFVELRKVREKNCDNHLALLMFSILANTIIDISMKFGLEGIYYTYWKCDFPTNIFRVASIYIAVHLIVLLNAFIKKHRISSIIVFNLIFLLGAIHYWTMAITNKEFTLKDFVLIKTVTTVLSGVKLRIEDILYFLLYLILIVCFNILLWRKKWREIQRKEAFMQLPAIICYLILLFFLITSNIFGSFSYKTYVKFGFVSNLIAGIDVEKAPTHSEDFLKEIENYNIEETPATEEEDKVNVILIMSEAFSDLSVIGEFETNEDYMPYTRHLLSNTPSGYVYSSVYSNNTASSEYECLTGIPTTFAKSGGELYQSHMEDKEESLVSYFKEMGYQTTGIHPFDGVGYNRKAAWESFGFDKMLFKEAFSDAELVRNYVSDESFYEKIIKEYEESTAPAFIFGISMQNHATFLTDYEGDIHLENMDYEDVNEYLSLIKETDTANRKLIEYFENQSEKTMIVFFGDHQPMIDTNFYSEVIGKDFYELEGEDEALKYKIPYYVWTNYENDISVPKEISINYLPYVIIDALDYPKTEWYTFMGSVMQECPVITYNFVKENGIYEDSDVIKKQLREIAVEDKTNKYYLLKKYQVWSYKRAIK